MPLNDVLTFYPMPGVEGLEVHVLDYDKPRQIVDAVFRFPAGQIVARHRHVSQTNMFILSGELIMYEADGTVLETRPTGRYYTGTRDDSHVEGGGPNGATVLYSVRGHGSETIIEILGDTNVVLGTLTFDDVAGLQAQQT